MRVAVVCPYDMAAIGGVQSQAALLVAWLREAGHDAWLAAPGRGGPPGTHHLGWVVPVPGNGSLAPITFSPGVVPRLRRAVAGADVVHIHEPLEPIASLVALFVGSAPLVGTFHSSPAAVQRCLYRLTSPVLRRLLRRLTVATAVSPVAAEAVRAFAEPRLVPNGLDTARYRPGGEKVPGRVVFLGRDDRRKGLDDLLQAWPLVAGAVPGAELRVLGTARASGPEGVIFLGRVGEEQKISELGEASVVCAPNLGGESFGLVVAEGMAAGCAVVASDLAAFRHVAGGSARFFPAGDVAALAGALTGVLSDPGEAARMAAMGLQAVARFDRAAVLEGYLAAYRDALGAS